jgi:hypothetical protein
MRAQLGGWEQPGTEAAISKPEQKVNFVMKSGAVYKRPE